MHISEGFTEGEDRVDVSQTVMAWIDKNVCCCDLVIYVSVTLGNTLNDMSKYQS